MKIAFISQPFDAVVPPHQNSIGLWTYHVAPYVAQHHEVTVFVKRNKLQNAWPTTGSLQYKFVPSLPNRLVFQVVDRLHNQGDVRRPSIASSGYSLDYIVLVALALRLGRYDIAHIHNFTQFVPVVRAFNPHIKIALHMQGEWLSSLDQKLMRSRAEKADLLIGSSNHITRLVAQKHPHLSDRCRTVYNGVSADLFISPDEQAPSPATGEQKILFVGRISPEKGLHTLLEAFQIVAERCPEAHLNLVGPPGAMPIDYIVAVSDDPQVQRLAAYYQEDYDVMLQRLIPPHLADRVHFIGNVPQAQLPTHYQSADILVNPSYSESFGMSLVEAMASRKPVVATRVGGMVEVVEDGETGLLVEQGNPAALAEALLTLLNDPALRAQMGERGHQRVMQLFTWPLIARTLMEQYESLWQKKGLGMVGPSISGSPAITLPGQDRRE